MSSSTRSTHYEVSEFQPLLLAVAHDLRQPMCAIAGLAELLTERDELPDEYRFRVAEQIRSCAEETLDQLDGLLDAQRMSSVFAPHRSFVDLAAIVERAVRIVGGDVTVHARGGVRAAVDSVLFERIVDNLVRNARTHAPGTHIEVTCRHGEGAVVLTVEDEGPGVPEEIRPTLFEAFEADPRSNGTGGSGLGLYLVRRFAEIHGGTVTYEDRPGGGARFSVVLPTRP